MSWINSTQVAPDMYVVRFLTEPTDTPFAPFEGVCTLVRGRNIVTLHAMFGKVRRTHLKALCAWVLSLGAHTALAHRAEGHILPGAVERENGWLSIDVARLGRRL